MSYRLIRSFLLDFALETETPLTFAAIQLQTNYQEIISTTKFKNPKQRRGIRV